MPKEKATKVRITWNNTGGELDHRTATEGEAAAKALVEMLDGKSLEAGDSITVEPV